MYKMLGVALPSNVTVVIEAAGAKRWHNEFTDPSVVNRFAYQQDSLYRVNTQPLAYVGEA